MANRSPTPAERIASQTWWWLGEVRRRENANQTFRVGEETLTDVLIRDLLKNTKHERIKAYQFKRWEEKHSGADLAIQIRRPNNKADTYHIQAKKLYTHKNDKYENLKAGVQIDTLEDAAKQAKAIPLYLMYNHIDAQKKALRDFWNCGRRIGITQLGCTMVPSWVVCEVLRNPGFPTFYCIHSDKSAFPWRCLFNAGCMKCIREVWQRSYDDANNESKKRLGDIDFKVGAAKWMSELWNSDQPKSNEDDQMFRHKKTYCKNNDLPLTSPYIPRWLIMYDPSPAEETADRHRSRRF